MPLDLTRLSDEELLALESGDLSKVSNKTLKQLDTRATQEPGFMQYAGEAISQIRPGISEVFKGRPETLGRAIESGVRALGTPSAVRTVPTMIAGVMAPPTFAASFLTAGTGYVGSKLAGDDNADGVANSIQSSYVGRALKPSSELFKTGVKEFLTEIGIMGGVSYASETAKRSMEREKFMAPSFREFAEDNKFVPLFGAFSGALRTISSKSAYHNKLIQDSRKEIGSFIDADELTLGMIDPVNYANIETRIAANNPKLFEQISKVGSSITDRYNSLFGKIEHPGKIAGELNKYAGRVDEERQTLSRLEEARNEAEQQLLNAQQLGATKDQLDAMEKKILSSRMAETNQAARLKYWDNLDKQTQGKLPRSSDSADAFGVSVSDIFEQRSTAAAKAYEEAGVPFKEKFIPVDALVTAAKTSLSKAGRSGPVAEAMIKRIEEAGGEAGLISVNDMRDMRRGFSDMFATADGPQLDAVEAIAKIVYGGITRKTSSVIKKTFGEDVAGKFDDVNSWWAETANAQNSKYMRQILAPEPGKNMISTLAKDISEGRMQDVSKFGEFIDSVSKLAPDVANIGSDALHKAIRESFIINASSGSNSINFKKLTESLNAASARLKKTDPINIDNLGFGNKKQLEEVLRAYQEFNPNGSNVTAQALDEFYSNPLVIQEIQAGNSLKKIATKSAARNAFERQVQTQILSEISGAKIDSAAYQNARAAAERAGVSLAEQADVIRKLKRSEIAMAFENMPQIGINAFTGREGQITEMFQQMAPKDAKRIFSAIQEQRPALAQTIERRIVADLLNYATSNTSAPGQIWSLDGRKVTEMFNPNLQDKGNPIHLLREIMPKDKFSKFQESLPIISRMADYVKYGGIGNIPKDITTALGISSTMAMGRPGGSAGAIGLWKNILNAKDGIKYNLAAAILTDNGTQSSIANQILGDMNRSYLNIGSFAIPVSTGSTRLQLILNDDKELANEVNSLKLDLMKSRGANQQVPNQ